MTDEKKKRRYEPPKIVDLSKPTVSGEGPLGTCLSGTTPFSACSAGDIYTDQTCNPGTYPTTGDACTSGFEPPGNCFSGFNAGGPRCRPVGSFATLVCGTGTDA